jgi:sulfite exporter TauE/SafE
VTGVAGAYAQLLALGLPWVSLHCGAMCGPIVAGLTASVSCKTTRIRQVGAYQVGRAVVYLPMGAAAGALGAAWELRPEVGAFAGLVLGAVLAALALGGASPGGRTLVPVQALVRRAEASPRLARAGRALRERQRLGRLLPMALAGTALASLPCMLPAWVLGLAAGSGSAWHGALLMALLLAMSALPLSLASLVWVGNRQARYASRVPSLALGFAAVWLVLGALATLHVVPHGRVHVGGVALTCW